MSNFDRRQFLKGILGKLAQAAGTVVVASAAASAARAHEHRSEGDATPPEGVQERAERLAATGDFLAEEAAAGANEFLNGGFRNSPIGAFRNSPIGAFRNSPIGAFRNGLGGAFRNSPRGVFGNGGWPNGVFGGFRNGGWPNIGWRNGWW